MSDNEFISGVTKGYDGLNLPYSLEAEQAVLGAILLDSSCMSVVANILKPECFHRSQHRVIYENLLTMFTDNEPIDYVTLLEALKRDANFDEAGGKSYLMQLAELTPSILHVEAYAKTVKEKYLVRTLIVTSREIIEEGTDGQLDASMLLDAAEQKIYDIRRGRESGELVRIDKILIDTINRLNELSGEDRDKYLGIPSGIGNLDHITGGLNKSDLILLAARPGMGKTSFALNIARNVAVNAKKPVAFFSFEMSKEQLVSRILSSEALVNSRQLQTGKLNPDEWDRIMKAAGVLNRTPMYFDDTPNITVSEMKSRLRRLKDVGLVVIDYLQLMTSGRRIDSRVNEVSEITRSLKIMAKELKVPVLTLSQLSRSVEKREDHKPVLSDLRDSGSIEQDADIVMFLYRETYYEGQKGNVSEDMDANAGECIVAKNRHGETGKVPLHWQGEFTRFTSAEVIHRD